MPSLRTVTVPADPYYKVRVSVEGLRPLAAGSIDDIISALTRPLTKVEAKPRPIVKETLEETIKVTAESYTIASEKFNELFLKNQWADGLPIIPPTEEAVKWMLKGTTRSPAEIIGQVAPKNGTATIEKIAINAVMAGAKPEYLPVIIAAMEGFTDRDYNLTHVQCSTGSFTPIIFVNGPIAKELNINSGIGFLGHGWRANSTIGRALRLCLLNLGHTWPQVNDMATIGRQSAYSFFTFAENEAQSPWKPYHVDLGYKPKESTVTVSTGGSYFRPVAGGAVVTWTAKEVLQVLAKTLASTASPQLMNQKYIVAMAPELAHELAQLGFTKDTIKQWLHENARIPYSEYRPSGIKELEEGIEAGRIPTHVLSKEQLKEGGVIPVVKGPEAIHIIVVGGIPGYTGVWNYGAPAHQTKKIYGATLTKAGR